MIGCVFFGDPFHSVGGWDVENEIGLTWKRFEKLYKKNQNQINLLVQNKNIGYEIHLEPDEYKVDKKYYVFVGVEVNDLQEIPLEMFGLVLPQSKYATFTFKGKNMFSGGDYIWKEWFPQSKYEEAYSILIQVYDRTRFQGLEDENSELDYLVPIKEKISK